MDTWAVCYMKLVINGDITNKTELDGGLETRQAWEGLGLGRRGRAWSQAGVGLGRRGKAWEGAGPGRRGDP